MVGDHQAFQNGGRLNDSRAGGDGEGGEGASDPGPGSRAGLLGRDLLSPTGVRVMPSERPAMLGGKAGRKVRPSYHSIFLLASGLITPFPRLTRSTKREGFLSMSNTFQCETLSSMLLHILRA